MIHNNVKKTYKIIDDKLIVAPFINFYVKENESFIHRKKDIDHNNRIQCTGTEKDIHSLHSIQLITRNAPLDIHDMNIFIIDFTKKTFHNMKNKLCLDIENDTNNINKNILVASDLNKIYSINIDLNQNDNQQILLHLPKYHMLDVIDNKIVITESNQDNETVIMNSRSKKSTSEFKIKRSIVYDLFETNDEELSDDDNIQCIVCSKSKNQRRLIIPYPCKHMNYCDDCIDNISQCVVCKNVITKIIKCDI
jgi:hypothetical protein